MSTPRTLLAAAGVVGLAAVAAGCGNSTSASSNTPRVRQAATTAPNVVQGTLNEWSVGVSQANVKAGKVTFDVKNTGKAAHEFVVLRTDKPADKLGTGARISESGNVGEAGDIAAGASKSVTLDLKPGHYSLVCNLPGHYKLGMHTDFTVS